MIYRNTDPIIGGHFEVFMSGDDRGCLSLIGEPPRCLRVAISNESLSFRRKPESSGVRSAPRKPLGPGFRRDDSSNSLALRNQPHFTTGKDQ
jgi:hypothetical protein